jgi:hypothetical protein
VEDHEILCGTRPSKNVKLLLRYFVVVVVVVVECEITM